MTPHPPTSTLFPYTTLFRSGGRRPVSLASLRHRSPLHDVEAEAPRRAFDRPHRLLERRGGQIRHLQPRDLLDLRSEEHTSELQSHVNLVCRLLLEKKKKKKE